MSYNKNIIVLPKFTESITIKSFSYLSNFYKTPAIQFPVNRKEIEDMKTQNLPKVYSRDNIHIDKGWCTCRDALSVLFIRDGQCEAAFGMRHTCGSLCPNSTVAVIHVNAIAS